MPYAFPADVQQLIQAQLATGSYDSEDEVIRQALLVLQESEADFVAIQEALAERIAGDQGLPLDDAFDEIRRQLRLAPRA